MSAAFRVLVIDDDSTVREVIKKRLERRGYLVDLAADGAEGVKKAEELKPDVAICDIRMPGMNGFEVTQTLKIPTIIVTGHGDKESAIKAVELGAFAFFEKPFDLDSLELWVRRAAERFHLEKERTHLLKRLKRHCRLQGREIEELRKTTGRFIGECKGIVEIKSLLQKLARKPHATLLILGETGTGKEVVAQELHELTHSKSAHSPFLALNCASIPTELFESELYGHEKGSFSGAHQNRIGLAEAVRDGTLFLDEIGEMNPRHQAKLLRLLQERTFRRVGSNKELPFKGRIIAATHRDLRKRSKAGDFREDLFYRLSLLTVDLPPLRDRSYDIDLITESLCEKHGLHGVAQNRRAQMHHYDWPGNIRELNNWIERSAILELHNEIGEITAEVPNESQRGDNFDVSGDLKEMRAEIIDHYDRKWIEQALRENGGKISQAAKALNIDRKNLSRRMQELGIPAKLKQAA